MNKLTTLQLLLNKSKNKNLLKGELKFNEALDKYTTWRIGGIAECLYQAQSSQDLQNILSIVPEQINVFWLGLGSNVEIRLFKA